MKWIVYFCCWLSHSSNDEAISLSGAITITADSVITYVYPYQYVEFAIVKQSLLSISNYENSLSYGIFYLSHPNGSGLLTITPRLITLYYHLEKDGLSLQDFAYMSRKSINKTTGQSKCLVNCKEDGKTKFYSSIP